VSPVARRAAALIVACAGALLLAFSAGADRGVAVDLGRIDIDQPLAPGGAYRLPELGVRNPGDERTSYRVKVWPVRGAGLAPPEDWFRIAPDRVTLRPNEIRKIQTRIVLPPDAAAGDYAALLGPEIVSDKSGASVGAAAVTRLTFTVESASTLEGWWNRFKRWFDDHLPWTAIVPALLLAALAADRLRRRFRFAIEKRS
jgi:hypothetical protein